MGTEMIFVIINGKEIRFGNLGFERAVATIDNLHLSQAGVEKEFPDLKDNPEWKSIAVKRFKEKIYLMKNEKEISDYIVADLAKYGYQIKLKAMDGFRPVIYS